MMVATLKNWNTADRKAGNAFISLHDRYSNQASTEVTVPVGGNVKAALEAAGWKITSGTRKNMRGEIQVTVEKIYPGLRGAQKAVPSLVQGLI